MAPSPISSSSTRRRSGATPPTTSRAASPRASTTSSSTGRSSSTPVATRARRRGARSGVAATERRSPDERMRYREHHPLLLPTGDVVAVALLALALLVGLVLTDPQGRGLPGSFGGGVAEDFLWAVEPGPLDPFAVGDADTLRQTVAPAQAVIDDAHHFDFGVSLVATFPTA